MWRFATLHRVRSPGRTRDNAEDDAPRLPIIQFKVAFAVIERITRTDCRRIPTEIIGEHTKRSSNLNIQADNHGWAVRGTSLAAFAQAHPAALFGAMTLPVG